MSETEGNPAKPPRFPFVAALLAGLPGFSIHTSLNRHNRLDTVERGCTIGALRTGRGFPPERLPMRKLLWIAAALWTAFGAGAGEEAEAPGQVPPAARVAEGQALSKVRPALAGVEEIALAMVVDSRQWPEEAAALEVRPYKMLLDKVRIGPDEETLRALMTFGYSHRTLLTSPEGFRGKIVHVQGIIAEIRRTEAPGVGRYDRNEVYAGILVNIRQLPRRPVPVIKYWAFRALRRPNEGPLYAGDRVNLSGYFLKGVPVVDAADETHWMPLVVGPWPTYPVARSARGPGARRALPKWMPIGVAAREAGLEGLLPTREVAHERVWSRLVLDVDEDGRYAVDGAPVSREDAVQEARRSAALRPRRAVVARVAGERAGRAAREMLAEAGVERTCFKKLPGRETSADE